MQRTYFSLWKLAKRKLWIFSLLKSHRRLHNHAIYKQKHALYYILKLSIPMLQWGGLYNVNKQAIHVITKQCVWCGILIGMMLQNKSRLIFQKRTILSQKSVRYSRVHACNPALCGDVVGELGIISTNEKGEWGACRNQYTARTVFLTCQKLQWQEKHLSGYQAQGQISNLLDMLPPTGAPLMCMCLILGVYLLQSRQVIGHQRQPTASIRH